MLNWVNILHIYQPPIQDWGTLRWIADQSYYHLAYLLKHYPDFKITLNISGSLTEQLEKRGFYNLINKIKEGAEREQVEFLGSAMYHPILPLLPKSEIKRQIELNERINKKCFGDSYKPNGFFPPEMAYCRRVGEVVKDLGYSFVTLDEAHFPQDKNLDVNTKYIDAESGLEIIFRDRGFSKSYPPEKITKNLENIKQQNLVTAHDGEMYGLWHKDEDLYYDKIFTDDRVHMIQASEYLSNLKESKIVSLRSASWETTEEDLRGAVPYPLWDDPQNEIHTLLWELARLAIEAIQVKKDKENEGSYFWARKHLDQGLSSCSWWWASNKEPDAFTGKTWSPSDIEKGINELIKSIRSLKTINLEKRKEAEKIYLKLLEKIWDKHWSENGHE